MYENLLAEIVDGFDDIVWALSLPSLTPIFFNDAALRLYQCSHTELIDNPQRWLQAIALEDQPKMQQAIAAVQVQGWAKVNYRILLPDGTSRSFLSRLKISRNALGEPMRIEAIASVENNHPLIELKTEDIVLPNESRYFAMAQQQSDLILRSRPDSTICFANEALCSMVGKTIDQIIGRKWHELANAEDLRDILDKIALMTPENPSFINVNRDYRSNGQFGWTQWLNQGNFDSNGQLVLVQSVGRDITALKLTEQALIELNEELEQRVEQRTRDLARSEARNRTILQTMPDLLLLLKSDGTCLEQFMPASPEWEKYVPIQKHISEVLSPEDLQIQLNLYQQAIATGTAHIYEHQITKFGKTTYEEVRIAPYFEDELLVIVRDITSRKLAEARLLRSESHLRSAQRIGKIGSWEYEISTDKIRWSEEVFRLYGIDSCYSEPSYEQLQQYVHPSDWENFNQTVQNAVSSRQSYELEHRLFRPNGDLVYVLARGEMVLNESGEVMQIIGTAMDITDRKLAEAELNRSRELREAIFNESADALFLVDAQTLLTIDCNNYAVQLFEASDKSQLIGIEGHTLQRSLFSDEEMEKINLELETNGFWSLEVEYISLQGRVFWGNLAAKPITLLDKKINLVRVTDISDRKLNEAKIIHTAHQLELTNRELESFSYSVSHDLRAPLRHMNGFVNALQQQLQKHEAINDPKVIHYLDVVHNSSQKMGHLIDGLLTLSRYGRRPLEAKQISTRQLVDSAIEIVCADSSYSSHVEFAIGNLPHVIGDPTLIQQVFCNLIGNAIKFSRNQTHPRIEIDSLSDQTIKIKDNGVGFQMEYADKLFGAFQRLHNEKEFEGTGIGLAIVQRIIQRHNGEIWAESQPNNGATFFIRFAMKR